MKHIFSSLIGLVILACTAPELCESTVTINADRDDVTLYIPNSYDKEKPLPLVVMSARLAQSLRCLQMKPCPTCTIECH